MAAVDHWSPIIYFFLNFQSFMLSFNRIQIQGPWSQPVMHMFKSINKNNNEINDNQNKCRKYRNVTSCLLRKLWQTDWLTGGQRRGRFTSNRQGSYTSSNTITNNIDNNNNVLSYIIRSIVVDQTLHNGEHVVGGPRHNQDKQDGGQGLGSLPLLKQDLIRAMSKNMSACFGW